MTDFYKHDSERERQVTEYHWKTLELLKLLFLVMAGLLLVLALANYGTCILKIDE